MPTPTPTTPTQTLAHHIVITPTSTTSDFAALWRSAIEAGVAAANAVSTPMHQGPCGFAWVTVRPATTRFARWLKLRGIARVDHYAGGMKYWVSDYGQSYDRKSAHADAVAQTLRNAGVTAYAGSRLD